jgi:hypothetical protein
MKSFLTFIAEQYTPEHGTQYGSNDGGIHTDTKTGKKMYIKYYHNPDQAKVEALTGKIYNHMGLHTLNPQHEVIGGRHAVVTEWNPNLNRMKPHEFDSLTRNQAHDVGKMYHAAVLTKNWDIVGLEHDNIVKHNDGTLHAIDHGGAMHFRAQGGPKDYDGEIGEHGSLRNNSNASGHVFKSAFSQHPDVERSSLSAVKNIDDDHIHHLFKTSGLSNWQELHSSFMARKQKLLAHYGEK